MAVAPDNAPRHRRAAAGGRLLRLRPEDRGDGPPTCATTGKITVTGPLLVYRGSPPTCVPWLTPENATGYGRHGTGENRTRHRDPTPRPGKRENSTSISVPWLAPEKATGYGRHGTGENRTRHRDPRPRPGKRENSTVRPVTSTAVGSPPPTHPVAPRYTENGPLAAPEHVTPGRATSRRSPARTDHATGSVACVPWLTPEKATGYGRHGTGENRTRHRDPIPRPGKRENSSFRPVGHQYRGVERSPPRQTPHRGQSPHRGTQRTSRSPPRSTSPHPRHIAPLTCADGPRNRPPYLCTVARP